MSQVMGVLIALAIGLFGIPTFLHYEQVGIDNAKISATAQQLKQVSDATQQYVQANATAIEGVATATVPATITVPILQATGYLPASFSAANPYGQTWQAQALQPVPGQLQVVVLPQGGTAIPAAKMTQLAALAGQQGGFVPYASQYGAAGTCAIARAPCMMGTFSGWQISMVYYANPGAGHAGSLLYFNNGNLANNYLYRNAVPGNPALNTMNTPLIMGATATAGTACSPNGAIAQDGTGAPLDCISGTWKSVGISCAHGSKSFASPGTYSFNTPLGCTSFTVTGCGGGGGGGAVSPQWSYWYSLGGQGGGAGTCVTGSAVSIPMLTTVSITVGSGGVSSYYFNGGGYTPYATAGGNSYIVDGSGTNYINLAGGAAGVSNSGAGAYANPRGNTGIANDATAGQNSSYGAGGTPGQVPTPYSYYSGASNGGSATGYGAGGGGASGQNEYPACCVWVGGSVGGTGSPGFLTLSW